jgi:histidinol phosphatase-like enzyme
MKLRKEIGRVLSDEQFESGYTCYREITAKEKIRNPAAWITTAALKNFKIKNNESEKIRKTAKQIEVHFSNKNKSAINVYALNKYLEIIYCGHHAAQVHCL